MGNAPIKAHIKKHFPTKILKFKKDYDWKAVDGYDLSGFTEKFARLLTDRLFQYAFYAESVRTVDDAKCAIHKIITHYLPCDAAHTDCFMNQYWFCKTAFGAAQNTSSALKSPLSSFCFLKLAW